MFLSQLILDPRSRAVRRDLANFYDLHRTLLSAYPHERDGKRCELLFRAEPGQTGQPAVMVQSMRKPDWQRLPPAYALSIKGPKTIEDVAFQSGQRLRFRLRANPSKRLRAKSVAANDAAIDSRWINKRVGLLRETDQEAWLGRKGTSGGFRLLGVRPISQGSPRPWKNGADMSFTAVLFDGLLEVTDAGVFRNTLFTGIGSGKAFGFGLLSVAPA